MIRGCIRSRAVVAFGFVGLLLLVLVVVDTQPGAPIAMFGALVVAALLVSGTDVAVCFAAAATIHLTADDGCRLRGSFRRQEHPDTPGRPMPRAPGSVLRPDRWLRLA